MLSIRKRSFETHLNYRELRKWSRRMWGLGTVYMAAGSSVTVLGLKQYGRNIVNGPCNIMMSVLDIVGYDCARSHV
jgi:hypothetical protein